MEEAQETQGVRPKVDMSKMLKATFIKKEEPKEVEASVEKPAEHFDPREAWDLPIAEFRGEPVDAKKYPDLGEKQIREIEYCLNSVSATAVRDRGDPAWYIPIKEGEDPNNRQASVDIIDNVNRPSRGVRKEVGLYPTTQLQIATLQEFADRLGCYPVTTQALKNNIGVEGGEVIEFATKFPGARVLLARDGKGAIIDAILHLQRPLTGDEANKPFYLTDN